MNKLISSHVLLTGVFSVFTFLASAQTQVPKKDPGEKIKASETSHTLQAGNNSNADAANLVSIDQSGDASLSIPIVNVKGRTLSLPIQANYRAGVKVGQKSSEIGLGWNIPFGSIVRDYGAFEPDYSSTKAEAEMVNTSGAPAGTLTHSGIPQTSPYNNNKDLTYNMVSASTLTPDNYHVSIPGIGGNTFWNNGAKDQAHSFVFSEFSPWKITFQVKTYEIHQEFSRINEINYNEYNSTTLNNSPGNLAAAICIPQPLTTMMLMATW